MKLRHWWSRRKSPIRPISLDSRLLGTYRRTMRLSLISRAYRTRQVPENRILNCLHTVQMSCTRVYSLVYKKQRFWKGFTQLSNAEST
jgi:hypothetical protein